MSVRLRLRLGSSGPRLRGCALHYVPPRYFEVRTRGEVLDQEIE
jgi:hypothetical protein